MPVFYVILPSLLLYRLLQSTGVMDVLGLFIARLVPERSLQVLLLVIGLAPLAESVSGFGVGTILVIPIFIALGYSVAQAALLGSLGQMAVPWGGLGIGTALGAKLTGLAAHSLGARTALLLAPLPATYGLLALFISGGQKALRHHWLASLAAGGLLAAGLWGFSLVLGIELAGILAGGLVIVLLLFWGRWEVLRGQRGKTAVRSVSPEEKLPDDGAKRQAPGGASPSFERALAPYGILTAWLLTSRLVLPLKSWLQSHGVISLPAVNLHLPLLYHPGFGLLLTVLAATRLLKIGWLDTQKVMARVWQQFLPGSVAITCFLTASQVMQASGLTGTLGAAAATLGGNYKWVATWLATLGGWVTGSGVGSNALFSQLQQAVSLQSGLPLEWLMAAQNGASAQATLISPARVILITTAVGWLRGESFLLRRLALVVFAAVVVITLLLALAVA